MGRVSHPKAGNGPNHGGGPTTLGSSSFNLFWRQKQERGEPAITLFDLFLGEWGGEFSARALRDHPVHLQGGLVYPLKKEVNFSSKKLSPIDYFVWGNGNPTHSLVLETLGEKSKKETEIFIQLPKKEVQDEVEVAYYLNIHPDTEILIEGKKATTFQLGNKIEIYSKNKKIKLIFLSLEGEGVFWGHLYRGNRPGQLCCQGASRFEAYDWVIALRTVYRNSHSTVSLEYTLYP